LTNMLVAGRCISATHEASENLEIDLTAGDVSSLGQLVAYINAQKGYSASLINSTFAVTNPALNDDLSTFS